MDGGEKAFTGREKGELCCMKTVDMACGNSVSEHLSRKDDLVAPEWMRYSPIDLKRLHGEANR